jgi:hypothetical protein
MAHGLGSRERKLLRIVLQEARENNILMLNTANNNQGGSWIGEEK